MAETKNMEELIREAAALEIAASESSSGFSSENLEEIESQTVADISQELKTQALIEVEDQKIRTLAQGLSFGFADEMEGFITSLLNKGVTYEQARDQVRKEVADYQAAKPGEALTFEIIGAVAPTVASLFAGPGGWANAMRTIATLGTKLQGRSSIGQVANMSGKQTALYSVGKGEDGLVEDLYNVPGAYVAGATIGGTIQGLGQGSSEIINRLMKTEIGKKFSKPVRDALEQMIAKTGQTAEQIVQGVKEGRLLVENDTLRAAIKAITSLDGNAAAKVKNTLAPRVTQTKENLLDTMGDAVNIDWRNNLSKLYRDQDAILAKAENEAYDELFNALNPKVTAMLKDGLLKNLKKLGSDGKQIESAIADLMTRKDLPKLLSINKNGSFKFARPPTLKDAEMIYRMIRDLGGKYKQSGDKDMGMDFTIQARELKELIAAQSNKKGDAYDLLGTVRTDARNRRIGEEAYEFGIKKATAPGTMGDDLEMLIEQYKKTPGALEKLQMGVMSALKHKKDTGTNKNIAMENTNLQRMVSLIFPEQSVDDIIAKANIATASKETMQSINYGTTTNQEAEATKMLNSGLNSIRGGEDQNLGLSAVRAVVNIIRARNPQLSPKDASQLAEVVVSQDAKLVERALVDEVELSKLGALIDDVLYNFSRTAASGTSKIGGTKLEDEKGDTGLMNYVEGAISNKLGNLMQQN